MRHFRLILHLLNYSQSTMHYHYPVLMLILYISLHLNYLGPVIEEACSCECRLNIYLSQARFNWFVPLIVLVRNMETTRVIALTVLVMIGVKGRKILDLFDKDLYL